MEEKDPSEFIATEEDVAEIVALTLPKDTLLEMTKEEETQLATYKKLGEMPEFICEREEDYQFARDQLRTIITTCQGALLNLTDFADQSRHPKAYEVVGLLLNYITEANNKLIELHQQRQEMVLKEKEIELKEEKGKREEEMVQIAQKRLELDAVDKQFKREYKTKQLEGRGTKVTNNNLFVGSPAELLSFVKSLPQTIDEE